MNESRGVFGVNLGHRWHLEHLMSDMLRTVVHLAAAGTFTPVVDRALPLAEAAAHTYIQEHKNFGKVVLSCRVRQSRRTGIAALVMFMY